MNPDYAQSLRIIFQQTHSQTVISFTPLTQDGSSRAYFRAQTDKQTSFIIMRLQGDDAEALKESRYSWVDLSHLLQDQHIPVPKILSIHPEISSIIIDDCGDFLLEDNIHLRSNEVQKVLVGVTEIISNFLQIPSNTAWTSRSFDSTLLTKELEFFHTHCLQNHLHLFLDRANQENWKRETLELSSAIARHSYYFVHRDFHSRNLMVHNDKIFVIDFQDARLGSSAYDLLSFCFDPYMKLDFNLRLELVEIGKNKMASKKARSSFDLIWNEVLLQRMLKIIGSFCFLSARREANPNLRDYLHYIPSCLTTMERICLPNLNSKFPFLTKTLFDILSSRRF